MLTIPEFFATKTVVITGGTGYVGKCLVEKLLRDCPKVKQIYLIIRPKRGETSRERFSKYLTSAVFDRIRDKAEIWSGKLQLLEGDISLDSCGLSPKRLDMISSAHVFIHAAAAINFNLPLTTIVKLNVGGTKYVIDLAMGMKNLQAFVYVSTAYVLPTSTILEERVYPIELEPLEALKIFQDLPENWMKEFAPTITAGRNTYQYSKHLAERLVESYQDRLPVCIVRPGTIVAARREPFPGWNEVDSTISEYFRNVFSGTHHMAPFNSLAHFPVTPVDTTVNTVLAAAWNLAVVPPSGFSVYNCIPNESNRLRFGDFIDWGVEYVRDNPYSGLTWYPRTTYSKFLPLVLMVEFIFRFIPALVADLFGTSAGKTTRVKAFKRAQALAKAYSPFALKDMHFTTHNMIKLGSALLPEDRSTFPVELLDMNWKGFTRDFAMGLNKFSISTAGGPDRSLGLMARYAYLEWMIPVGVLAVLGMIYNVFCSDWSLIKY